LTAVKCGAAALHAIALVKLHRGVARRVRARPAGCTSTAGSPGGGARGTVALWPKDATQGGNMRAPMQSIHEAVQALLERTARDWGLETDWRGTSAPELILLRASASFARDAGSSAHEAALAFD
jgi:hypothetical protein